MPLEANETPWTARVLVITHGVLSADKREVCYTVVANRKFYSRLRSINFRYLWLIPATKILFCLSQHKECAVSLSPNKCKIDFSFGTPRSVSQTVMQWSFRLRSCPIANRFVSFSCHDSATHGLDCLGAGKKTFTVCQCQWTGRGTSEADLTEFNVIFGGRNEIA